MSAEENKAIVRRVFEEVWNKGNLDIIDELVASDFVRHDPASPEEIRGREGIKQFIELYQNAFPDTEETVEDQVAEGDMVVTRWRAVATHQGELMGVPPLGNRGEITGIDLMRISGGKIAEGWTNYDALGMMRQIGAFPEPGE